MKKNYIAFVLSVVATVLQAQTVLYTNNFDNPGGFTLDAGSFNAWAINNVYQGGALFSGSTIPNVPSQPSSFSNPNQNYLHPASPFALGADLSTINNANYVAGSGFGNLRAVMNTSIDAAVYTNITVSFWRIGGLNGMKLIYSINGGQTWQDAGLNFQGSPTVWTQESISIPALANQSNVRIGFNMAEVELADPAPNPYHSIDELTITGASAPTGQLTVSFNIPAIGICSGQNISVGYNVVGGTLNAGNIFSLELSDATGDFSTPTVIGTLNSTQSSGTITGTLTAGISGSNFRLRVSSSNAAIIGNDNGTDFAIALSPEAPLIILNTTTGQLQVSTTAPSFEWQFFGTTIPNSQNQFTITPSANGGYTVIATNGSCSTSSTIYTVSFVGLEEDASTEVLVFPNPFESSISLQYEPGIFSQILVFDLSGQLVFSTNETLNTLNLDSLQSGSYFIQLSGEKNRTIRVVKY